MKSVFLCCLGLILLISASSCSNKLYQANLEPAPVLPAPNGAGTGGVQALVGVNKGPLTKPNQEAGAVVLLQAQGYYAITKLLFVEGEGGYLTGTATSPINTKITSSGWYLMPGLGLYGGENRLTWLVSAGMRLKFSSEQKLIYYPPYVDYLATSSIHAYSFYEKAGLRYRFNNWLSGFIAAAFIQTYKIDRTITYSIPGGSGISGSNASGTVIRPFFGISVGPSEGVSGFLQLAPGALAVTNFHIYRNGEWAPVSIGATWTFGKRL